jgi:class 3 adenylate cyclase
MKDTSDPGELTETQFDLKKKIEVLTRDLGETQEQQRATSEVLRVISRSTFDLKAVLDTLVKLAARLCEADTVIIGRPKGESYYFEASYGFSPEYVEFTVSHPVGIDSGTVSGRVLLERKLIHIPDVLTDPEYRDGRASLYQKIGGYRALLGIPLLREGLPIGVIVLGRNTVRPFTDRQITLATTFADQAVIAIESVRLFDEVQAQAAELASWNRTLEQRVAEQVAEIERIGRLKRFLPAQIAQLVASSHHERALESHRRDVTILFCDLRGFTAFSEVAEPEEVMLVLREYHTTLGVLVDKFEGTVERFTGDGLLVIFNDPMPCPDPQMRAVQMALEMRDEIAKLSAKWSRSGHDIGFGIGIAHGYATLGTVGYERQFQYSVTGKVANLASRLCNEAKNGQILIDINVFSAVETRADVEFTEELILKGFSRPVKTFNVRKLSS